ncbi:sigma factor G inhibitor Gin [Amphibacillus cookii]|uniref:sigma factor G inhibitor Gin n=1 Tax=Amphibacillus cookii TaxID=767787 RepID=UPI001959ACB1|nr:sigma factor G inhibitor Gin [Amphibacillus cookii]MBM7543132.1 putative metal-binding protein [Amphibacillus cookii]
MHQCSICDNNKEKGIFIYHLFVCEVCEQKLLNTEPEDPNYRFFVNKLKKLHQQAINS